MGPRLHRAEVRGRDRDRAAAAPAEAEAVAAAPAEAAAAVEAAGAAVAPAGGMAGVRAPIRGQRLHSPARVTPTPISTPRSERAPRTLCSSLAAISVPIP